MGAEIENRLKTLVFRGERHDNKILKVQSLSSNYFVVIAHAPITGGH